MTYDNYRKRLKAHLEHQDMTSLGVTAEDFGTHSFRIGGLSVLGNDGQVQPAFIQKSARHKHLNSTTRYIQPSLKSSLAMSDILCGNDPNKGWSERFTGRKHTTIPFLNPLQVKSAPTQPAPWWETNSAPTIISSVRKTPPGPAKTQPSKRKAGIDPNLFGKRRSSAGTQPPPTLVAEGGQQSSETPLRNEAPRAVLPSGNPQDPGYLDMPDPRPAGSTGNLGSTFPYPNSIGALRARLSGVTITNIPDVPSESSIPAMEEETNSLSSPQDDLDDGEDLVTGEGLGTTEF